MCSIISLTPSRSSSTSPSPTREGNLCLAACLSATASRSESRDAVARRDRLIEKLASLSPVPGALDQIVQRFGTDMVAEVTGRSRRIIRKTAIGCWSRTAPASANLAETAAFMDDAKRILVFSDAGGTGRSYHAELSAQESARCAFTICSSLAGRRTPPFRAWAAPTGPTRRSRTGRDQNGGIRREPASAT